jgi:predicted PhzF superfamily epimerase YddE/YHI9
MRHATLASAHVLLNHKALKDEKIEFHSKTDCLSVEEEQGWLYLDFPARPPASCRPPAELLKALVYRPVEVLASVRDYLVVFDYESTIKNLNPDMNLLKQIDKFGVIATAPGQTIDFVSRFFCPGQGIPEDPVTGSSHCTLIPYWSEKLSKVDLKALQLSARGRRLMCRNLGQRVKIWGKAVTYSQGWLEI